MAHLTNNNFAPIINLAYKEMTGMDLTLEEGKELNLQNIIDSGDSTTSLAEFTEQFTKALIVTLVKNFYTDSDYSAVTDSDDWLIDNQTYGGIIQSISVEVGDARESGAWHEWTNGDTISTADEVMLPIIRTKLYGKANSAEFYITLTENQFDDAFNSEAGVNELISYIMLVLKNKISVYMESMSAMNRNHYMAYKIDYAQSDDAKGTHVVNIVKDYCDTFGIDAMTVAEFMKDADAMRWASRRFKYYANRLRKDSVDFNIEGLHRFVPIDRLVFHMNADFVSIMDSVAYANTFHEDYIKMDGYKEIPYWQFEEMGNNENGLPKSMEINIKTNEGKSVNAKNIIGFMSDRWAIRHVIVDRDTAVQRYERYHMYNYYYQIKDKFEQDYSFSSIVFTLDDVTNS